MFRTAPGRRSDSQAQQILDMIARGEWNVGDRLPGQRELAEKLNIGRSTLREAIRHLEALGVLETHLGLGTYVASATPYSFEPPFNAWLEENRDKTIKIFEVREALESKAAELAALKASEADWQAMQSVWQEMRQAVKAQDLARLSELDYAFHSLISKAADNNLLSQILDNIGDVLGGPREAILSIPGRSARSLEEHAAILSAIRSGDASRAKEMMIQHLSNAVKDMD